MSTPTQDISGTVVPIKKQDEKKQQTQQEKKHIHIYHVKDTCLRCGRDGHFSSACYAKKNKYGETIESDSEYNSE
jgi:hypothetical protein